MRRPPEVTTAMRDEALAAIHRRHADDDNTSTHLLSDDPVEVLTYLRRRGVRELRGDEHGHDIEDALTLRLWLWWTGEAAELWLLDAAEGLGLNRRRIGARLGVRTGQGLVDRREYKRHLLAGATAADQAPPPPDATTAAQRWLEAHRRQIHSVASTLVDHWDLADDEAVEWLVEVRSDLRDNACTPGSFAYIGWAVEAVDAVPAVRALPADHPLRQALVAWPALADGFAAAGKAARR
jgi:hypothetical protein